MRCAFSLSLVLSVANVVVWSSATEVASVGVTAHAANQTEVDLQKLQAQNLNNSIVPAILPSSKFLPTSHNMESKSEEDPLQVVKIEEVVAGNTTNGEVVSSMSGHDSYDVAHVKSYKDIQDHYGEIKHGYSQNKEYGYDDKHVKDYGKRDSKYGKMEHKHHMKDHEYGYFDDKHVKDYGKHDSKYGKMEHKHHMKDHEYGYFDDKHVKDYGKRDSKYGKMDKHKPPKKDSYSKIHGNGDGKHKNQYGKNEYVQDEYGYKDAHGKSQDKDYKPRLRKPSHDKEKEGEIQQHYKETETVIEKGFGKVGEVLNDGKDAMWLGHKDQSMHGHHHHHANNFDNLGFEDQVSIRRGYSNDDAGAVNRNYNYNSYNNNDYQSNAQGYTWQGSWESNEGEYYY